MLGYCNALDFGELDAMKYYAPPVSWPYSKKRNNVTDKIFSNHWLGAEKKDGYFVKIIKDDDGNILLYSRSRNVQGKYVNEREWVPQCNDFFSALPNATCVLGELYFPNMPGSMNVTTVMQCLLEKALKRQETGEKLHLYIFDVLSYNGNNLLNTTAESRFDIVHEMSVTYNAYSTYVEFAQYYRGVQLWEKLQNILSRGGEGIVITREDALYEPGKRPSKTTLKVKKELHDTIDCFFTGKYLPPTKQYTGHELETWKYWEDKTTGEKLIGEMYDLYKEGAPIFPVTKSYFMNLAGSLEIGVIDTSNNKIVSIGYLSGLSEEIKANVQKYSMLPIEITAMEFDIENLSLRHGKFCNFRGDITIADCSLEKIKNR